MAPILYNRRTTCHYSGGIAPFALITYNDAMLHPAGMKADVLSKKMPPGTPDPTYSYMAHERVLYFRRDKSVHFLTGTFPSCAFI